MLLTLIGVIEMIFYPTESLIYGLFFLGMLFKVIQHVYVLSAQVFDGKGYINVFGRTTMLRTATFYLWLSRLFLVLAIASGVCSSFLELS